MLETWLRGLSVNDVITNMTVVTASREKARAFAFSHNHAYVVQGGDHSADGKVRDIKTFPLWVKDKDKNKRMYSMYSMYKLYKFILWKVMPFL